MNAPRKSDHYKQPLSFDKIYSYKSFPETLDCESACQWQKSAMIKDGSFTMPYPIYGDKFLQFIEDVSHSDFIDVFYKEILQKYGLER